MIRSNNEGKPPNTRPLAKRQNVLYSLSNVITKIPTLDNEVKKRVPYTGRFLLSSPLLSDSTKMAILKKLDPTKAEKLQKLLDTSNKVLDVTEQVDNFHKTLTEKTPEAKNLYAEFKNNPLGGKSKKNKRMQKNKTKKRRNKTNKRNKKQNRYTRYEKTKNRIQ